MERGVYVSMCNVLTELELIHFELVEYFALTMLLSHDAYHGFVAW